MKFRIEIILLYFCFVPLTALIAEPNVLTNVELLDEIAGNIAIQTIQNSEISSGDTIYVDMVQTDNILNTHFNEQILLTFNQHGIYFKQKEDSTFLKNHLVIMPMSKYGIVYKRMIRRKFWREKLIEREGFAGLTVRFQKNRDSMFLLKDLYYSISDTVPFRMRYYIEQNGLSLKPVILKEKNILSLLEPIFAFAITGFVVYLFYRIRSE